MIELNSRLIAEKILLELEHEPTAGQLELIGKLADFVALQPALKQQPAFLMKGYAGTGKTTLVSALVRVLPLLGMQSVLLAPTGRAAKVLAGYSRKQANTIHRKIYRSVTNSDGKLSMGLAPNPHKFTLVYCG